MRAFTKIKKIMKKHNTLALLICIAGIALNITLNAVSAALELPLFLDTAGTIAVAVMGGYLPGAIVGFATNMLESFSSLYSLYYGVLNILIAIFATYLSQKGWFRKITGIIGAILVFTLISGGLGAFIPWCLGGPASDVNPISRILYETGYFGDFTSQLASGLLINLADKTITVLAAVALIRVVPESCYNFFYFNLWQQNPALPDIKDGKVIGKAKIRVMSLRTKSLIVLVTAIATIAVSGVIISLRVHNGDITNERAGFAKSTARTAAAMIDGDKVDEYLEKDGNVEGYIETKERLASILNSSEDILYLYVYKIEEDGCHVVFDIDTEDLPGEEIGTVISFDEDFSGYIPDLLNGNEIETNITDDKYGYLLTAYQPVYDSDGRCVCYVGADVDLVKMAVDQRSFLMKMISIYSGFLILICTFVLWLVDYHIVFPVRSITDNVDSFPTMGESQEDMDEKVKEFRNINVHTGDELESLYNSLCMMTINQTEQMRSIRGLSESTAKMQDGLIITMADMVENRDSDTGAHIQKTAAYVKIIVNGLKEKGYYAEKITPKFMSDVVRSAPLHDVGKINIPDEVLNKPGKLTDEEYAIMKTHAVAGRKIMEKAISTVKGENYLKEARNMAAYHHERWDGKGYPDGLHGEAIPLSARIMAVADVFDALTSPRVYKPAFPLEKALSILQEGSGTQFDPKCIEVFMESLTEVKVVLKKYNENANV